MNDRHSRFYVVESQVYLSALFALAAGGIAALPSDELNWTLARAGATVLAVLAVGTIVHAAHRIRQTTLPVSRFLAAYVALIVSVLIFAACVYGCHRLCMLVEGPVGKVLGSGLFGAASRIVAFVGGATLWLLLTARLLGRAYRVLRYGAILAFRAERRHREIRHTGETADVRGAAPSRSTPS